VGIFLNGGEVVGRNFFENNTLIHLILLLIILICVPWMLVIKPYLLFRQFKHDKLQKQRQGGDVELERVAGPYSVFIEDNRNFSDEEIKEAK